jgi:two-component system, cell cycle response regulator
MTARVLVVDDILANVRLLEAKLTAEYFEVHTAMNGVDALESVQRVKPDIVLLDVMMPGMDGIEVCRRIKGNTQTHHIPVIMVTALDQPDDRVRGLEAGADDFLTKPVSDLALFCRVKSLVRLKMLTDELRSRVAAGESMGLVDIVEQEVLANEPGKILLIDNHNTLIGRIKSTVGKRHDISTFDDPQLALFEATEKHYELIIINLDFDNFDGLRLCSQLRSLERTRQVPILIIVDPDDHERLLRALDMGVNDYLLRPVDKQELMARVNTQIKRWRYTEQLRTNVKQSIEMAVTDALTGLYNRRFMEKQLSALAMSAANRGKPLAILVIDVDYFKSINDNHGHDVGDRVLQELSCRLKDGLRNLDLACRTGGEEFIIVLPDTDRAVALRVGERLRKIISLKPFNAGVKSGPLSITVSIGVAAFEGSDDSMEGLLKRADDALYQAKRDGRNRVTPAAA